MFRLGSKKEIKLCGEMQQGFGLAGCVATLRISMQNLD
jgi:hypothetical protein